MRYAYQSMLPLVLVLLGSTTAAPIVNEFEPAHTSAEAPGSTETMMLDKEGSASVTSDISNPLWQTAVTNGDIDQVEDVGPIWKIMTKAAMQLKKHVKESKSRSQDAGHTWSAWKVAKKAAKKIKNASRQMQKGKARKAKRTARQAAKHAATCVRLMELAQQEDDTAWPEMRDTMQLIESCRAAQVAAATLKKAAATSIKQQLPAPPAQRFAASKSISAASSASSPSEHKASSAPAEPSRTVVSKVLASSDSHQMLMQELRNKIPVYDP